MKNNKLDSFESFINEQISGEEVAYNASDWNDLSNRLDAVSPTPFYKKGWFLGGAAAIVVGASTLLMNPEEEKLVVKKTVIVHEQPIEKELSENGLLENDFIAKNEVLEASELNEERIIVEYKNIKSETKTKEEVSTETLINHHHQQKNLYFLLL